MRIQGFENTINLNQNYSTSGVANGDFAVSDSSNIENNQPNNIDNSKEFSFTEKTLSKTIEKINKALNGANKEFRYSVHDATRTIMVKVMNKDSGEVIREIPSEKILDMLGKMWEMSGVLVDHRL